MPTLFKTKCDQCGHTSEPYPEHYAALELDEATGLESSNPHPDNPADAVLPKSGQKVFLEAHGFTFKSAMKEGRILKYTRMYCRECGDSFEHRRYHISGLQVTGCLWPMIASAVIGLITGILTLTWHWGVIAFLLTLMATSAVVGLVLDVALKRDLKDKIAKNRDKPRCPHCASIETAKQRLKCEKCGLRSAKQVACRRT